MPSSAPVTSRPGRQPRQLVDRCRLGHRAEAYHQLGMRMLLDRPVARDAPAVARPLAEVHAALILGDPDGRPFARGGREERIAGLLDGDEVHSALLLAERPTRRQSARISVRLGPEPTGVVLDRGAEFRRPARAGAALE